MDGIRSRKLYVTVYPKDTEAKRIWHEEVGLPLDHIIDVEDNFWDIGAGPCGPDTEIFYDRGEAYNDLAEDDPENYPGGENERYLEIWNLVFSEFNHKPDNTFEPLPHKTLIRGWDWNAWSQSFKMRQRTLRQTCLCLLSTPQKS